MSILNYSLLNFNFRTTVVEVIIVFNPGKETWKISLEELKEQMSLDIQVKLLLTIWTIFLLINRAVSSTNMETQVEINAY